MSLFWLLFAFWFVVNGQLDDQEELLGQVNEEEGELRNEKLSEQDGLIEEEQEWQDFLKELEKGEWLELPSIGEPREGGEGEEEEYVPRKPLGDFRTTNTPENTIPVIIGELWQELGPSFLNAHVLQGNSDEFGGTGTTGSISGVAIKGEICNAAASSGGIWRTTNFHDDLPTWTPQTDNQACNAFSDIRYSPDQTFLLATNGLTTSGPISPPFKGIYQSTDDGATWNLITVNNITNLDIQSVVIIDANTWLVTVQDVSPPNGARVGIWRTTNAGDTWTRTWTFKSHKLATYDSTGGVLIATSTSSDKQRPTIIRSLNQGATWTEVSTTFPSDCNIVDPDEYKGLVSQFPADQTHYVAFLVAIKDPARCKFVYYSESSGATWTKFDISKSIETSSWSSFVGLRVDTVVQMALTTSSASAFHFFISATGPSIWGCDLKLQDNSASATTYCTLFRKKSAGADSHTEPTISDGPHADYKSLSIDPVSGELIATTDGGIYRYINPDASISSTTKNLWRGVPGINNFECTAVGWDPKSTTVIISTQDNAVPTFKPKGNATTITTGDGAQVQVDTTKTPSEFIIALQRAFITRFQVGTNDSTDLNTVDSTYQFDSKFVLNQVNPTLLALCNDPSAATNKNCIAYTYTLNGANRQASILLSGKSLDYYYYGGTRNGQNDQTVFLGYNNNIFFAKSAAEGTYTHQNAPWKNVGNDVIDVSLSDFTVHPDNYWISYVITKHQVWETKDFGRTFTKITGNLLQIANRVAGGRIIPFKTTSDYAIAVSTEFGVFVKINGGAAGDWQPLQAGFPNVVTKALYYSRSDDFLLAGTYGRGAWGLSQVGCRLQAAFTGTSPCPAPKIDVDVELSTPTYPATLGADGFSYISTNADLKFVVTSTVPGGPKPTGTCTLAQKVGTVWQNLAPATFNINVPTGKCTFLLDGKLNSFQGRKDLRITYNGDKNFAKKVKVLQRKFFFFAFPNTNGTYLIANAEATIQNTVTYYDSTAGNWNTANDNVSPSFTFSGWTPLVAPLSAQSPVRLDCSQNLNLEDSETGRTTYRYQAMFGVSSITAQGATTTAIIAVVDTGVTDNVNPASGTGTVLSVFCPNAT